MAPHSPAALLRNQTRRHSLCRSPMLMARAWQHRRRRLAVFDQPFALDHDPVRAVRPAKDQRGKRVVAPEKRTSSSRKKARSACLPTAISPMSLRPRQRAEPSMAQRRHQDA